MSLAEPEIKIQTTGQSRPVAAVYAAKSDAMHLENDDDEQNRTAE
jgi:hypothetical protein